MSVSLSKAFTMIELVFVIVVIAILTMIAAPRFAATRDDAFITKARATIGSVRSAIASERQKRLLRGDFTPITSVDSGSANTNNSPIFDHFDGVSTTSRVLEYPLLTCKSNEVGCWKRTSQSKYTYYFPYDSKTLVFDSNGSRFDCVTSNADCQLLTQ